MLDFKLEFKFYIIKNGETNCPGIFAAGDVRLGSIKRVASAVGEGAMAIQFIHQYLGRCKGLLNESIKIDI